VPRNGQFQSVCFQLDHIISHPLSCGPGTVLLDPCTQKAGRCFSALKNVFPEKIRHPAATNFAAPPRSDTCGVSFFGAPPLSPCR
jgi:hypothetical protein